jgi:hypothetical protein
MNADYWENFPLIGMGIFSENRFREAASVALVSRVSMFDTRQQKTGPRTE